MNSSQSCHAAQRSRWRTEQLKAQPTACQKSSARDQTDADWPRSRFSGLILPSVGCSSSARRCLPRRDESKWVKTNAEPNSAATGPTREFVSRRSCSATLGASSSSAVLARVVVEG
jgi:hypothetical protein